MADQPNGEHMGEQLTVLEAVIALSHDPDTGKRRRDGVSLGVVNAAAIMCDLLISGHLVLEPRRGLFRTRKFAVGPSRVPLSPELGRVMRDVVGRTPSSGMFKATWMGRRRTLSTNWVETQARESLERRGVLWRVPIKVLGYNAKKIVAVDRAFQQRLEEKVRTALDGGPADHHTLAVTWVLYGSWFLRRALSGYGAIRAGHRARQLEKRDELSRSLRYVSKAIMWGFAQRTSTMGSG